MLCIFRTVLLVGLIFITSAHAKYIKIGVICPTEGALQVEGLGILYGVKAAVSSMKSDGVLKPNDQIEVIHYNTSTTGTIPMDIIVTYSDGSSQLFPASKSDRNCAPGMSASAATKLANDNVQFVIGAFCSATTKAAALILDQHKIPLLTPGAIKKNLTQRKFRYLFRICNREDYEGIAILNFISKKLKPKSIYIVNTRFSGIDEKSLSELTENGIQIAGYEMPEQYSYSTESVSRIIEEIATQKPEAVLLFNGQLGILKGIRIKSLHCQVAMTASPMNPVFYDKYKPLMEGVYVTARNHDVTTDGYIQFKEEFRKAAAGRLMPNPTAAFAFDGTQLAVKALFSIPLSDPEQYRSAILNASYQGVSKHIQFHPSGDSTTDIAVSLMRNGQLVPYWTDPKN